MTNREFFIERWNVELKATLTAVKGLPANMETLNYRPDPKSRSAHEIIGHILPHADHLQKSFDTGVINEVNRTFSSVEEAAEFFEHAAKGVLAGVEAIDDHTWETKMMDFAINGNKAFSNTMKGLFWMLLFDIIHHRGQLSTYYRPMGVRNPSFYGPTAEDREERLAAAAAAAQN